jgi:hypothetical protein
VAPPDSCEFALIHTAPQWVSKSKKHFVFGGHLGRVGNKKSTSPKLRFAEQYWEATRVKINVRDVFRSNTLRLFFWPPSGCSGPRKFNNWRVTVDDPMKNPHARAVEKDLVADAFAENGACDNEALKAAVTEVIPDISGIQMLKWCWVLQQQRVSKILEFENSLGITIMAHQDIQLLAKLAGAIINHQTESSETQWTDPHERTREIEKLGPSTQKISTLNAVDQMLMRQAATIVIDTIRENAARDAAKAAEDSETAPSEKDLAAEAFREDSAADKDRLKDVVT